MTIPFCGECGNNTPGYGSVMSEQEHEGVPNVDPEARSGFGEKLSETGDDDNISTAYPPENPTADEG